MKERRGLQRHVAPVAELPPAREEPPFLRSSQKARGRRARRGSLGRIILLLEVTGGVFVGVLVLWTGYTRAMANERLRVARVDVKGSRFLSEKDVRDLLGPAVGESILALDIGQLKTRLKTSPWVADARVTRTLPDTLKVEIEERTPLALAEVERLYLMDGDGVLIDMYGPRTASFDLPIVRGLGAVDQETRREWAAMAGALLRDLGDLAREISEVEVERAGDLRAVLRGAGDVVRLGGPPYRARFLTFLRLRRELLSRYPDAEYFDLRFRNRVVVKHAPGSTPTPAPPEPAKEKRDPAPAPASHAEAPVPQASPARDLGTRATEGAAPAAAPVVGSLDLEAPAGALATLPPRAASGEDVLRLAMEKGPVGFSPGTARDPAGHMNPVSAGAGEDEAAATREPGAASRDAAASRGEAPRGHPVPPPHEDPDDR